MDLKRDEMKFRPDIDFRCVRLVRLERDGCVFTPTASLNIANKNSPTCIQFFCCFVQKIENSLLFNYFSNKLKYIYINLLSRWETEVVVIGYQRQENLLYIPESSLISL